MTALLLLVVKIWLEYKVFPVMFARWHVSRAVEAIPVIMPLLLCCLVLGHSSLLVSQLTMGLCSFSMLLASFPRFASEGWMSRKRSESLFFVAFQHLSRIQEVTW